METKSKQKNVDKQGTSSHREERLVLGSLGVQEPEHKQCGITHYAGCACHEQGWENKWNAAVEMAALATVERDEARRIWSIYQDQCAELRERYAMHHAEAELITIDNIRLKCTLAKWIEWARMHGHLEHAAGIADDSRRLISPENANVEARR